MSSGRSSGRCSTTSSESHAPWPCHAFSARRERMSGGPAPIPPPLGERSGADAASQCLPAKALRNIPSGEADESLAEVIQVLDPRHPLYGRSFRVVRRAVHQGGNFLPSYEVEYRHGTSLLVPVSATEPDVIGSTPTKLSIEALRELIEAAECLERDEHGSERSLGGAAAGSSASDHRRRRRGSGGDVS